MVEGWNKKLIVLDAKERKKVDSLTSEQDRDPIFVLWSSVRSRVMSESCEEKNASKGQPK